MIISRPELNTKYITIATAVVVIACVTLAIAVTVLVKLCRGVINTGEKVNPSDDYKTHSEILSTDPSTNSIQSLRGVNTEEGNVDRILPEYVVINSKNTEGERSRAGQHASMACILPDMTYQDYYDVVGLAGVGSF